MTATDDNICNEIINGWQIVARVTCDYQDKTPPIRGRYVTIKRKDNANKRHVMNFCEVEVLSCPSGRWGYNLNMTRDCSQSCEGCRSPATCRVSDGHCFIRCRDGLWGVTCKRCDCKDDAPCRKSDGYCYNGCKNGLWGGSCDEQCVRGPESAFDHHIR